MFGRYKHSKEEKFKTALSNTLSDPNALLLFKTPNRINPVVVNEALFGTKIKVAHIRILREALIMQPSNGF